MKTERILYRIFDTPIGRFAAGVSPRGCCLLEFHDRGGIERIRARVVKRYRLEMAPGEHHLIDDVERQLTAYFAGTLREFSVPLDLRGTPFEMSVWNALLGIPYGETRSYGEIAAQLGKPGAARAVGRANGANEVAVIVPCHRVIQEDGQLRGYGGGLWRKKILLDLERGDAGPVPDLFEESGRSTAGVRPLSISSRRAEPNPAGSTRPLRA